MRKRQVINFEEMSFLSFNFSEPFHPNTLYLDKDGILNEVILRGNEVSSPRKKEEFKLCKQLEWLKVLAEKRQLNLVIISNQPDLSRKLIDITFVEYMLEIIKASLPISIAYICPHTADCRCSCRKPKGDMIESFRENFSQAVKTEYFLGDMKTDLLCSQNLKIPFFLKDAAYNSSISDKDFIRVKRYSELKL